MARNNSGTARALSVVLAMSVGVTARPAMAQSIQGTATYRERMALPPSAVSEATLEDASRADAVAEPLARLRLTSPGNPPSGRLSGSDGCNRVTGSYERMGAAITFGPTAGTQIACINVAVAAFTAGAQAATQPNPSSLEGTRWQLVKFQGGDGTTVTPDDRAKYTIEFAAAGRLNGRVDCNQGRGTWMSAGTKQLEFGPLVLTRATCPPGSLHDQIVKQWGNIRSYIMKDGHLFLSLMADGGIYEFEPLGQQSGSLRSPVQPRGPATWTCVGASGEPSALRVTFYPTQPALVLLERDSLTKPAFLVRAASGARYEGDDVMFWEVRGEATLNWTGASSTCRPN
jgi:heat shock protein HslJ